MEEALASAKRRAGALAKAKQVDMSMQAERNQIALDQGRPTEQPILFASLNDDDDEEEEESFRAPGDVRSVVEGALHEWVTKQVLPTHMPPRAA